MTLPVFNNFSKYELTIPSTKQKIKFRPFLVKEQKLLLIAMETQDQAQILNAIVDTIQVCVLSDIDVKTLTSFDVEYIFIQIRSKSVGEKSTVNIACEECESMTPVDIELDKVTVPVKDIPMSIKLNDVYTIKLRYPTYQYMLNNESLRNSESMTESLYQLILGCLDKLQSEDETIKFDDETRQDVDTFIESLNPQQFEQLVNFVQDMPKLSHPVNFKCQHCKHDNKSVLQGINDFF